MPDRLKASVRLTYGRNAYLPGEIFVASSIDAKTLVATGLAARVEDEPEMPALLAPKPVAATPTEPRTHLIDAIVPLEPKRKRGRPRKGEYLHRQMRAKE